MPKLRASFMYDLLLLPGKIYWYLSSIFIFFLHFCHIFYEKMRHCCIETTNFLSHPLVHHPLNELSLEPKKSWITFTYLLSSRLTLSNAIFLEITPSFRRISSCLLWSYIFSSSTVYKFNKNKALSISELIVANKTILNILKVNILLLSLMKFVAWNRSRSTLKWSENFSTCHWMQNLYLKLWYHLLMVWVKDFQSLQIA